MSVEVQAVESISVCKNVSVSVNLESIPKPDGRLSELMGLQLIQESVSETSKTKSPKSCNNEEISELMGLQLVQEYVSETSKTKSSRSCNNEETLEVEAISLSYTESHDTDLSVDSNGRRMIIREKACAGSDEPSWWDRLCVPTIEESYGPVCGDPSLDVIDDIVSLPPTISDVLNELNTPKLSTYFKCIPLLEEVSSDGSESQEAPCDNFKWYGENDI